MHRTTEHGRRGTAVANERGIALLIVLIVVALLTITVTEFTYSVQLDQHRTRNAIYALQAQLLARSGINLAEGFLMMDDQAQYDAYTEDWWVQLNDFCQQGMQLEESMRVRCRVRDESGKLNINNTRGSPLRRSQAQAVTGDAILRDAMRCMFQHRNIPVDVVDRLAEYWQQDTQGDSTTQTAQSTPQPGQTPGTTPTVPEFTSLEDFASTFGIPSEQLHQLRTVLTAQPKALMPTININTATAEVLSSVLNAEKAPDCGPTDEVSQILQRQSDVDQVFHNTAEISSVIGSSENATQKRTLFGVTSKLYELEASALTNIDPTNPTGGGIGQTLSSLVYRYPDPRPRPGGPQAGPTGAPLPNWTLRPLDWQKEGGARLFRSAPTEETTPGSSDDEEGPNGARPSG